MLSVIFNHVIQAVLPSRCLYCYQKTNAYLCAVCQQNLPILSHNCYQCAQFLSDPRIHICLSCQKAPPPFEATYALFPYEDPIAEWIVKLKFQHQLKYAALLGELFCHRIQTDWYAEKPLPDRIVPVPLHRRRFAERGFNQAIEIAKPIAKACSIFLDKTGLKRVKYTAPQSGLSANERRENMHGAFQVDNDYTGLSVAILDDVITTGHTVFALSQALKEKGAKSIHIWCCARRHIAHLDKTRYISTQNQPYEEGI